MIIVSTVLLNQQIKHMLDSNMPEQYKAGLHNLLGEIYDELEENKTVTIVRVGTQKVSNE